MKKRKSFYLLKGSWDVVATVAFFLTKYLDFSGAYLFLIQGLVIRNSQIGFLIAREEDVDEKTDFVGAYYISFRFSSDCLLTHPLMLAR